MTHHYTQEMTDDGCWCARETDSTVGLSNVNLINSSQLQIIKPILQAQNHRQRLLMSPPRSAIKNKTHRSSFVSAPSASNSKLADDIPPAASLADAKNNILMVIVVEDIVLSNNEMRAAALTTN